MNNSKNKLTPSLENYLEAILIYRNDATGLHGSKDIADFLKVQMSSVTVALKNLREKGLVNYEKNSFVVLIGQGETDSRLIPRKNTILYVIFIETYFKDSIRQKMTDRAACEIEHILDL